MSTDIREQTTAEITNEQELEHEPEAELVSNEVPADEWGSTDPSVLSLPAADMRVRALPIRPGDLTRLLMDQPGLDSDERRTLGQLCRILGATFHSEFYERLRDLKEHYGCLDPDSDYVKLDGFGPKVGTSPSESFLNLFEATLERANFEPLPLETIKAAVEAPNEAGLSYVPDFSRFEQLRVYVRGYTQITRECRTLKSKFRKVTVTLDAYQRMIVAIKFRPDFKQHSRQIKTDALYLRMFKDVPHVDMEMHLPEQGTKVRMRMVDKAQIASPFAVIIPTMVMKGLGLATVGGMGALAGLIVAPLSAGVNSFFGFQRAKQKHLGQMIRSLYYMTLANNASVLNKIVDSAEEEEYKETLLAYFFLWQSLESRRETWDPERLDKMVEDFLKEKTGIEINFEINDALGKLFRLGLARRDANGDIRARPIKDALAHLDRLWDNIFRYSNTPTRTETRPTA